jgi:hypothetical protein
MCAALPPGLTLSGFTGIGTAYQFHWVWSSIFLLQPPVRRCNFPLIVPEAAWRLDTPDPAPLCEFGGPISSWFVVSHEGIR